MAVFSITFTISLCLAFTLVLFFLCERMNGRKGSAENESLVTLPEESPRLARVASDAGAGCTPGCRCEDCPNHRSGRP